MGQSPVDACSGMKDPVPPHYFRSVDHLAYRVVPGLPFQRICPETNWPKNLEASMEELWGTWRSLEEA